MVGAWLTTKDLTVPGARRVAGPPRAPHSKTTSIKRWSPVSRLIKLSVILSAFVGLSACGNDSPTVATGCSSDVDCKGERICTAGECVDPTPTAPTPITQDVTSSATPIIVDAGTTADILSEELPPACTVPGTKPTGAACTDHCECRTGYCYDEDYLGGFRFCTRECGGVTCGSEDQEPGDTVQRHVCLQFNSAHIDKYGLTKHDICQKRCNSVDECKLLGSAYDYCPNQTQWEGYTMAAVGTCQIESEVTD